MTTRKPGRPELPPARRRGLPRTQRWREDELELLEQAAAAAGVTVTELIRSAALARADDVLRVASSLDGRVGEVAHRRDGGSDPDASD